MPEEVVSGLEDEGPKIFFLRKISPLKATGQPLAIYLAAPDDDPEQVLQVRRSLEKYSGQLVLSQQELKAYIKSLYSHCGFINRHFDLVFRMVEQELAISSAIAFMRSTNSEWSYNIFNERFVRKRTTYDFSVIDVLKSL